MVVAGARCEGGGDPWNPVQTSVVAPEVLADLIGALAGRGYRVLGPTVRDGAIVYEDLESAEDLPVGWKDVADAASYRLERRDDEARFGYAVGPHSWKQFLFPPKIRLWQAQRGAEGFEIEEEPLEDAPLALIGVRACELHAIAIQDKVFLGGSFTDRDYAARRKDAFIVAVNCFEPSGTCFCVSMGTGPKAGAGYDLALTEILDGTHRFLVEVGTERGAEVLQRAAGPCRGDRPTSRPPLRRSTARPSGWAEASTPPTSATCSRGTSRATAGTTSRPAASPAATARWSARPASARASRTSPT